MINLLHLVIIIFSVNTVSGYKTGLVDMQKLFRKHEASSSYNFFLNRFELTKDREQIEKELKLIRNLHLKLLTELDTYVQKQQLFNKRMTKQYQELKSNSYKDISSKLISMSKKLKLFNKNHFLKLINLKATYQKRLDLDFKNTFMSHSESQIFWKKVLSEILTTIDKIRVNKGLSFIVQNKIQDQDLDHFFSQLDNQIGINSPLIFRKILRDVDLFSIGFSSITRKISTDISIKLIPKPIDINKDVIHEF